MKKKWIAYDKQYDFIDILTDNLKISRLTAIVLTNRDAGSLDKAEVFLNPSLKKLHDPYWLMGMEKAVHRITRAIEERQKICVYGDYDVDGITSTAILMKTLKYLNADVDYYIPSRMDEGYGLNLTSVRSLIDAGVDLFITVDCGIRSIEVVDFINSLGKEIIITDHHECGEELPKAYSIINPHQPECKYPFKYLAGVGVVFKLVHALSYKYDCTDFIMNFLDIVCVGTIADVVPLIDENRIIAKSGLNRLACTNNIGLKALLDICSLYSKKVSSYNVGFNISPRINAIGRISDASLGVELLLTEDEENARAIAKELDDNNKFRQNIEKNIFDEALAKIESTVDLDLEKVIVLHDNSWHIGVIGIVASKITNRYNLPSIIISTSDGLGKGSARSIDGFNIYEAMNKCSDLFIKFGGHELAAGLTIEPENIDELRRRINEIAFQICDFEKMTSNITVDYRIDGNNLTLAQVKELEALEPFGCENPWPNFVFRNLIIKSLKCVGVDGKHLSLRLWDGISEINGIAYNQGSNISILSIGIKIDIICNIEINSWNGIEKIQLNIRDIKVRK